MPTIHSGQLPQDALLNRYAQDGSFTDCYYMELPQSVAMQDYISTGGDSGGPWFSSGVAKGIHSGRTTLGPSNSSVSTYTEISMATAYMNTTVREVP